MLEAFRSFPEGTLVQLINNQLIMAAAPLDVHQLILGQIHYDLFGHVKKNNLGQVRIAPYDVFLSNRNVFQPDICFIANENLHKIEEDGSTGGDDVGGERQPDVQAQVGAGLDHVTATDAALKHELPRAVAEPDGYRQMRGLKRTERHLIDPRRVLAGGTGAVLRVNPGDNVCARSDRHLDRLPIHLA